MTFKKIVAAVFLVACSLTLINAGRRFSGTDTTQATCPHATTEHVTYDSVLYPGLKMHAKQCTKCKALTSQEPAPRRM